MGRLRTLKSSMRRVSGVFGGFAAQTRGNVAMIFALVMPMLILMTVGGVDIHRASMVRANLQDALDAATLAAARSNKVTKEDLTAVAKIALLANVKAFPSVVVDEDTITVDTTEDGVLIANASAEVTAIVADIFLPPYGLFADRVIPVTAHSEVHRSSKNIEVGLVLDITGSMAGQRITDLKAAAEDLVDIVIQDVQTPYYTRMAIIPYSMGVNLGTYANGARGTPAASKPISGAAWTTGSSKSISGISRNSPANINASSHGFATGDYVWISGVNGMTQINNRAFRVVRVDSNNFRVQTWNGSSWSNLSTSSGYSSYSSGGIARKCLVSDCSVVVTASNHGLGYGDGAYITGVNGMTQINNAGYVIGNVTSNSFSIGVNGAGWGNYSSGGNVVCGDDGCAARVFRNPSGGIRGLPISTCVSERGGSNAYTDASPTTSRVGRNYPTTERDGNNNLINPCPAAAIQPLSSDKETLKDLIDDLPTVGSTAGQIGIAWGWYSVSPNFNGLWNGAATASAYDPNQTIKSVIIMTDGEFNTPYCTGVIAQNAGTGSGGNDRKINCNGTNAYTQAEALCAAMRQQGVVVYTVGFQIASGGDAAELMRDCATSSRHVYLPETGGDLSEAFAAIGRDITKLRISR